MCLFWRIWNSARVRSFALSLPATSKSGWITMQMTLYPTQFAICIQSIIEEQFLTRSWSCFSLPCSTTTRAATSATCRLTCLWCGMETLSSTTRSTFKVESFLFFVLLWRLLLYCHLPSGKHVSIVTPRKKKRRRIGPACLFACNDFLRSNNKRAQLSSSVRNLQFHFWQTVREKGESVPVVWQNTVHELGI